MRKRLMLVAASFVALAIVFGAVACGDDDDDDDEDGEPTAEATSPEATSPAEATEPSDGSEASTVDVTLLEYRVSPDPESAAAGEVEFNVENIGSIDHEFVVVKTDLDPEALPTVDDGSVDEAGDGIDVIGEIEDIAPSTDDATTLGLDAGNYVLLCNIVDDNGTSHYQEGMHVGFTVE